MVTGASREAAESSRRPPLINREIVLDHRRRRAVMGAARGAHELGIGGVTVKVICADAKMARNTFYDLFSDVAACLRLGFRESFELIDPTPEPGDASEEESWPAETDAAIARLYAAVAAEPLLAELCLVHSFGAPAESAGHDFEAVVGGMEARLRRGRDAAKALLGKGHPDPGPVTDEYLARTIVSLAQLKLMQGDAGSLFEHRAEMSLLVATSYFGPEAGTRLLAELAP
jgi:AcrR family transcriptional regulator